MRALPILLPSVCSVAFGVSSGFSLCAKFSTLVILRLWRGHPGLCVLAGQRNWRPLMRTVAVSLLCAFLVTWAVYRFSHAPLNQVTAVPDCVTAKVFGKSSGVTNVVHKITSTLPAPIPEIPDGLRYLHEQNRMGTPSYIFGQLRNGGFWYFFIVSLALKPPFAVLLLAAFGTGIVVAHYLRGRSDGEGEAPLACAVMIMIVTVTKPRRPRSALRDAGVHIHEHAGSFGGYDAVEPAATSHGRTRCGQCAVGLDDGFIRLGASGLSGALQRVWG